MIDKSKKYDIVNIGLNRYGHQYGKSEKFKAFITATLTPLVDLQNVLLGLLDIDLDTAKGIKLDLLGRIVGAPAVIEQAVPQPFFGWDNQEQAQEFGEIGEPDAGGFWREMGQPSNTDLVVAPDDYKTLVQAQILKNKSICSPNEIIEIAQMILGDDINFKYIDHDMAFIIAPQQHVGFTKMKILTAMIPRPSSIAFSLLNGQYDEFNLTQSDTILLYEYKY